MRSGIFWIAASVALGLAGCQTVGLTGNSALPLTGFTYEGGTASQAFPFTATQVQTAVLEAMADLSISSVQQISEGPGATLRGRTADGRRATVTVATQTAPPLVTARIGWLGDEMLSRALMDRVSIRLGASPPSAIPSEPPPVPAPRRASIFGGQEITAPGVLPLNDSGYRDTPVP
jgi:Protein of unknown function (DUF3568)